MKTYFVALCSAGIGIVTGCTQAGAPRDLATVSEVCEMHHIEMHQEEVPVRYGMLVHFEEFEAAAQRSFPHALDFVEGGCVVLEGQPKFASILECQLCRKAKRSWLDHHPDYMNLKKRANQPPEPTAMSVTPRADARVAPAMAVAHL